MLTNFLYNGKIIQTVENKELKKLLAKSKNRIWIKASNITQEEKIILKEIFKIHPTTIEDISTRHTRIKYEEFEEYDREILKKIFSKELVFLEFRQLMESITDVCLNLTKPADNYINNDLIPYFRDVYDHAFKTTEGTKTMLGRIRGMRNIDISISSIKMNETIKALTIIMALMMPLTIITGFYGMY